ncbi:pickpocket protein 28-like [Anthonomus grandis grandis]|uniref:pickpocket protein 28-like n=1 Tax=Anthonomus grandis grandis TaxID=2921223 RepID=UPI002165E4BE|nr:pickpocket protein 28-like [Anthonomus grandis grandis]
MKVFKLRSRKITVWQSIKGNLRTSLNIFSISGVNYTTYDPKRSLLERLFWAAIILAMASLATWQGLKVYTHYLERPVIVTMDNAYFEWELFFPTATLCFQDLKSKSVLRGLFQTYDTKYNYSDNSIDEFLSYINDLAFKNYLNYEDYEPYANGIKKEYLQPEDYMQVLDAAVYTLKFEKPKPGRSVNYPVIFPLNTTRPVIRVFTEWGPCMVANANISIFYSPQYFNSTKAYTDYQPVKYSANTMATIGVKASSSKPLYIYIHSPNEVPDILDKKSVVISQSYKKTKYEAEAVFTTDDVLPLTIKQKNCRLPYEPNVEPLRHSPVYSNNLCKYECRIILALKYCNCTPYYYRRLPYEPICNFTGLYCLSKYKDEFIHMTNVPKECPNCVQNCDITIYRETNIESEAEFIQKIFSMTLTFPQKRFLRTLIFNKIDLTVQIGGIFGLFLGSSLLSLVEIIYVLTIRQFFGIKNRNTEVT